MGWTATVMGLAAALLIGLWARARSGRPGEPGRVRYVPYTAILFLAVLTVMLMLAHLLTLSGVSLPRRGGSQ